MFQTADAAEKIEKIIKQVTKSISFLDFLAVLMNASGKAENLADRGFLLPWLKTEWADSGYASCLVNAAPAFFSAWGPGKADCITVPYASAKDPVPEFIEASVYSMDELETIPYSGKQRVLYFAHGYSETETRWHLLALCRDHALVYAVLPDIYMGIELLRLRKLLDSISYPSLYSTQRQVLAKAIYCFRCCLKPDLQKFMCH